MLLHVPPTQNFTRIDNGVLKMHGLSHLARLLYWFYAAQKPHRTYNDKYVMEGLGLSASSLKRRKKELKDAGLLEVKQIGTRKYITFLGTTSKPAKEALQEWLMKESTNVG